MDNSTGAQQSVRGCRNADSDWQRSTSLSLRRNPTSSSRVSRVDMLACFYSSVLTVFYRRLTSRAWARLSPRHARRAGKPRKRSPTTYSPAPCTPYIRAPFTSALGHPGRTLANVLIKAANLRSLFDYINATGRFRSIYGSLDNALPDDSDAT